MLFAFALLVQLAGPQAQEDTTLRDARHAQARFERTRRGSLPLKLSASSLGHCDARIGRFCYWYDPADSVVEPEQPRVTHARRDLVELLVAAARGRPDDPWLAGQLVRYRLESNEWEAAARFASVECRAAPWWCSALEGMALHAGDQHPAAEAAFEQALASMPAAQRCAWENPRDIVDDRVGRQLAALDCDARRPVARALWTLGQPLWFSGGSDLRSEHLARLTMAEVLQDSETANGTSFGADSRELLLRFGPSEWYTRHEPFPSAYASAVITGHTRSPSYYFFPDVRLTAKGIELTRLTWRLTDSLSRSRYAPRHVKRLSELPHQLARFPRGDSVLLLAAFRVTDPVMESGRISTALALWDGRRVSVIPASRGVAAAVVSGDTIVASVEAHDSVSRHAQRVRLPVAPISCQPGWCLSDLLFTATSASDSAPDPTQALSTALADARLAVGVPLGVYWEMQSTDRSPVTVSLTVTPVRASVIRRVASTLRVARALTPVRLQWVSVPRRDREAHQVTVRLPDDLRGRFMVRLVVERPGMQPLRAEREIAISRAASRVP